MKLNLALEWIDALRSGDYTQGDKFLAEIDSDGTVKHCCLGVLAEICHLPKERDSSHHAFNYAGEIFYFPENHLDILKTTKGELDYNDDDGFINLASLNDDGYTFDEIADILQGLIEADMLDIL